MRLILLRLLAPTSAVFYNEPEGSLFTSFSSPITNGSNDYDIITFIKDNDSNKKLQFFVDLNASPLPKLGLRIRNGQGVQRTAILTETKPFLNFKICRIIWS